MALSETTIKSIIEVAESIKALKKIESQICDFESPSVKDLKEKLHGVMDSYILVETFMEESEKERLKLKQEDK